MEDLSEKLDRLLSSPDGMKRVEEMMAAFGASPPAPEEPPAAADSGIDIGMILKVLPLLENMRRPDEDAALLAALRPHLQPSRQKRLDEAGQILKMLRLMPLLKELKGDDDRE